MSEVFLETLNGYTGLDPDEARHHLRCLPLPRDLVERVLY